jgi:hypothetical protein
LKWQNPLDSVLISDGLGVLFGLNHAVTGYGTRIQAIDVHENAFVSQLFKVCHQDRMPGNSTLCAVLGLFSLFLCDLHYQKYL